MSVIVTSKNGRQDIVTTTTFTLPVSVGLQETVNIKNTGTSAVTVNASGSDTIDGETSVTFYENTSLTFIDVAEDEWKII